MISPRCKNSLPIESDFVLYFSDNDPHIELEGIGFERILPRPELRDIVQCYWGARAQLSSERVENLYPEGSWGVSFSFCDPLHYRDHRNPPSYLDGVTTCKREVVLAGKLDLFGVRFQPGAKTRLFETSLPEVRNRVVSIGDLGGELEPLEQRLGNAPSTTERVTHIEDLLLRLTEPPRPGLFEAALRIVQQEAGLIRVSDVAATLGASPRQLERVFQARAGVAPKTFARLARVRKARLNLKRALEQPLIQVALDAGYYDQSHFTREFQRVVGMTPGKYRRRAQRRSLPIRNRR